MNGSDIKKAAINKAKQVAQAAQAANGNGGKKRRKGQDLKPIITTEQAKGGQDNNTATSGAYGYGCMHEAAFSQCAGFFSSLFVLTLAGTVLKTMRRQLRARIKPLTRTSSIGHHPPQHLLETKLPRTPQTRRILRITAKGVIIQSRLVSSTKTESILS